MVVSSAADSSTFIVTTPSDEEIRMTRLFDAPRELVFEVMTKPEHVKRWWGIIGDGCSVPVCEIPTEILSSYSNRLADPVVAVESPHMVRNNRILWTLQILLAALYLFTGVFKLVAAPEMMQPAPDIPPPLPVPFLRFVGGLEVLGALGLILPGLTGIRPHLTWIAAGCLAVIMVGAVVTTALTLGIVPALFPLVVGVLDVIVMRGRRARGVSAAAAV